MDEHTRKLEARIRDLEQEVARLRRNTAPSLSDHDFLQTVIDILPDLVYIKDRNSRFITANNRLATLFRVSSTTELIGKTDFDFCEPELAQKYFDDEQKIIATGEALSHRFELAKDETGKTIYLYTSKMPLEADGDVIGVVGIGRDITELTLAREKLTEQKEELATALEKLRAAQSQLVQSEKLASLGILTAGIAHEINNPINFVYAGVNSMSKDFDDVKPVIEKMRSLSHATDIPRALTELELAQRDHEFDEAFDALEETLKDIKHGATRITNIVASLSKFSRMGTEDCQSSDLHEDLEDVLILLKNKYKDHIDIEREFDPDLPHVDCYPSKLNQAFMNILSNAIDAIDEKGPTGQIVIATRKDDDRAVISFHDNGVGMTPEIQAKIFDPFYTTKKVGKGTGLGMSITYSIVQDHNGQLTIESRPGVGTRLEVSLPIKRKTVA